MAACKFADCRRIVKKSDKKKAAICKICRLPQICGPKNFPMINMIGTSILINVNTISDFRS
jgi:hypothetical protein